jgi:SAM-dependent methyltransferase
VSLYGRYVLPRLVHLACGTRPVRRQRSKVVPLASGKVLELGFGSGLNVPFYDADAVQRVFALEPSEEMWELARDVVEASPISIEVVRAPAEEVPLPDASVDTVLVTYTLCTVPDPARSLAEARRVLSPGGRLVFCEHGEAPDQRVRRWQRRLTPLWRRLAGGCHLDRPIPDLLEAEGLRIDQLSTMYLPGWRPATFNYWGVATPSWQARQSEGYQPVGEE